MILAIIFVLIGAYPLSMLFSVMALSGGAVKEIKGWFFFLFYWASLVILSTPFIAIEYARA